MDVLAALRLAEVHLPALDYQPSLEQLLVLLPQGTAVTQAVGVHNRNTKHDYEGDALIFYLNVILPAFPAPLPLPNTTRRPASTSAPDG